MPLTPVAATPVNSTMLANVAYDMAGSLLEVEFRDGAIYQYSAVPEAIYQALIAADSKGAYFNRQIRDHFSYGRVRPPK